MIHLIEESHAKRPHVQRFVDRFAAIYTPTVFAAAMLVAVVPPVLFGAAFADWFYRALVLLVIACPCALVISLPVAIVSALAAAAQRGILIKGGTHLEVLSTARAMAFDKTGTLTHGEPSDHVGPAVKRHRARGRACVCSLRSSTDRSTTSVRRFSRKLRAWSAIRRSDRGALRGDPGQGRARGDPRYGVCARQPELMQSAGAWTAEVEALAASARARRVTVMVLARRRPAALRGRRPRHGPVARASRGRRTPARGDPARRCCSREMTMRRPAARGRSWHGRLPGWADAGGEGGGRGSS